MLKGSLATFQKERADVVSRNVGHSRPVSSTQARVSTPKPATAADTPKRTHEQAFAPIGGSGSGHELLTQMHYARDYLKSKSPQLLDFDSIIAYLSLPVDAEKNIPHIKEALSHDDRVEFVPKARSGNGKDSFKYRPIHPVTNAEELKEYMARRSHLTAKGVLVKELKDGWPDCVKAVDQLEDEHFLLVTRLKKDNAPQRIYPNSPSYHLKIDQDFKDLWGKTKLPASETDIRSELEKAGITPTSQVKEVKRVDNRKKDRKRPNRRGGKQTNIHMNGILKDYSTTRRS